MKVFVELFVIWLSQKETIRGLRLIFQSWLRETMDRANTIIVCLMFGPWIWGIGWMPCDFLLQQGVLPCSMPACQTWKAWTKVLQCSLHSSYTTEILVGLQRLQSLLGLAASGANAVSWCSWVIACACIDESCNRNRKLSEMKGLTLCDLHQYKIAKFSNRNNWLRPVLTQLSSEQSEALCKQAFLLIGTNTWLSQQISLNFTMKIPGTLWIEVLLRFGWTLAGSTLSALESDSCNWTSELITMLLIWTPHFDTPLARLGQLALAI